MDRLVLWEVLSLDTFGPSTLSMGALHGLISRVFGFTMIVASEAGGMKHDNYI